MHTMLNYKHQHTLIFSGNTTLTLPATTDTIAGIAATQTLTNKTITASSNSVGLATLDIDGGTDIGADLTTSDLIIVDDGAGGTNRKGCIVKSGNTDDSSRIFSRGSYGSCNCAWLIYKRRING